MVIQSGQLVPDFTLPASNGKQVSLSDFAGKYVLLYFYPRDMTPGCTKQACDLRDHYDEFSDLNVVILGVSTDPVARHVRFTNKHQLPFLLLADEEHKVCELFGVWQKKKLFGREYMGIVRSTFVIDPERRLMKEWPKVKVNSHLKDTLEWMRNQQDSERLS